MGFLYTLYNCLTDFDEGKVIAHEIYDSEGNKIPHIVRQPPDNGKYDYFNQIVLYPDNDLLPNHTYTVFLKVKIRDEQRQKTWSFTTAP